MKVNKFPGADSSYDPNSAEQKLLFDRDETHETEQVPKKKERMLSLDIFRGLTM